MLVCVMYIFPFHIGLFFLCYLFLLQQIHFLIKSDLNWSLKAEASSNSPQYTGFNGPKQFMVLEQHHFPSVS